MSEYEFQSFGSLFSEPVKNGIYKKKEFHGDGVKVVNMAELFAFERIGDQAERRLEVTERELDRYRLKDGDLLFARRSFVLAGAGKCSIVRMPSEAIVFESSIIRVRLARARAEPRYYFNLFRSVAGRNVIAAIASRTAVSGIRGSDLAGLQACRSRCRP